jgi:hypothetical protein
MECAFRKDLSHVYNIPEPCVLACHSDEGASGNSPSILYLIVSVVIIGLAVGGFAIYYFRIILPNLGEKETLIDWLRERRRDGDRTVRNNVLKGTRLVVRQLSCSQALFDGSVVFLLY